MVYTKGCQSSYNSREPFLGNVPRLHCIALLSKDTSSTFVVTLYHFSLCLNMCIEAFLLLTEPYPPILSLNLDLSLSTWYCAIMRLPTIFSSSRSLSSSMFGASILLLSVFQFFLLLLICILNVCPVSYSKMDFFNILCLIDNRR